MDRDFKRYTRTGDDTKIGWDCDFKFSSEMTFMLGDCFEIEISKISGSKELYKVKGNRWNLSLHMIAGLAEKEKEETTPDDCWDLDGLCESTPKSAPVKRSTKTELTQSSPPSMADESRTWYKIVSEEDATSEQCKLIGSDRLWGQFLGYELKDIPETLYGYDVHSKIVDKMIGSTGAWYVMDEYEFDDAYGIHWEDEVGWENRANDLLGTKICSGHENPYTKSFTVEDYFGDGTRIYLDHRHMIKRFEGTFVRGLTDSELKVFKSQAKQATDATIESAIVEEPKGKIKEAIQKAMSETKKDEEKYMDKIMAIGAGKGGELAGTLMAGLSGYIVNHNDMALTPSGLSINGKVLSKDDDGEYTLLAVEGTQFIQDIPFGFNIPIDAKDVTVGDIVFTESEDPLYVISKKGSNGKRVKLTCINPQDGLEVIKHPELDLFGNQTFQKLMTPFNYDLGCNPLMNMLTVGGLGFMDGGSDEVIKRLIPQAVKYMSKININKVMKDKRIQYLAPALLVAYKLVKSGKVDLKKLGDVEKLKKVDKKVIMALLVLVALIIYLNKDKVSEFLLTEKVKTIPVVGVMASPVAKLLNKIPSVRAKAFKAVLPKLEILEDDEE